MARFLDVTAELARSNLRIAILIASAIALLSLGQVSYADEYDRRVAFLVGFGRYEVPGSKVNFRDLPVQHDLEKLANALKQVGFDEVRIYSDLNPTADSKNEHYSLLEPGSPAGTRVSALDFENQFESRLNALSSEGRTLLLVYFTGHGAMITANERFLVTPASKINSPKSFVRVRQILNRMSDTPAAVDKILIVDACANPIEKFRSVEPLSSRSDEELPVYFFSSSMGEPSFVDMANQTSVFTYHLVEALTRARELSLVNSDGTISSEKVRDYLLKAVPKHKTIEVKRATSEDQSRRQVVQNPFFSGRQRLVIGHERDNLPPPAANADVADRAAYLRGLQEAFYGTNK